MPSYIYSDGYYLDWPGHVFPVEKYSLIYEKLIADGILKTTDFLAPAPQGRPGWPEPATEEQILLVHTKEYLNRIQQIIRNPMAGLLTFEIPVSADVVKAFYLAAGGTILAGRLAVENKTGVMNLSGGFHHAFADHGEGFCVINDLAVAIRVLQKEKKITRAMVIDCDLHQGNGTARIFAQNSTTGSSEKKYLNQNGSSVFTFSIHQENNYPIKQQSSLDIGLADFTGDDEYLGQLAEHIPGIIKEFQPDLIFYQAGVDPYELDRLGALKLTKNGLKKRDEFIISTAKESGIPLAITLGGGYAEDIRDVVELHCQTAIALKEIWT